MAKITSARAAEAAGPGAARGRIRIHPALPRPHGATQSPEQWDQLPSGSEEEVEMLRARPCSTLRSVFHCRWVSLEQEPPVTHPLQTGSDASGCGISHHRGRSSWPQDPPQVHAGSGAVCVSQRNQTLGNKTTKKRCLGGRVSQNAQKRAGGTSARSTRTNQLCTAVTVP